VASIPPVPPNRSLAALVDDPTPPSILNMPVGPTPTIVPHVELLHPPSPLPSLQMPLHAAPTPHAVPAPAPAPAAHSTHRVAGLLLNAFGVATLGCGLYLVWSKDPRTALTVGVVTSTASGGVRIRYATSTSATPCWFEGQPVYTWLLGTPHVGDKVIIRYDPENPSNARPDPSRATVGRWMVVLALLLLVPLWVFMATKRTKVSTAAQLS